MAEQHTPCTESLNVWRRRGFLRAAAVLAATGVSPRGLTSPTLTPTDDTPNFASRHITRNHPDYEQWRTAMPWQLYKAPRYPEAIVRPHDPEEVPDIVNSARRQGRRIAVKSGGHNVSEAFLRDGGVLLDLGEFQSMTVSADADSALVQPALWSHGLLQGLATFNRAFPVAHCATVPMGGFLMGGGIGYNHDNWGGLGCHAIRGAQVVTASGESLYISADNHPDLFWSLKGGGMGFPAIVTELELQLFPAPASVMETAAIFTLDALPEAIAMLNDWVASQPADCELMMLLANNPMAPPDAPAHMKKLAIARAVAFTDSENSSRERLSKLISHPTVDRAVAPATIAATSLVQMAEQSINPAMGLGFGRYAVDTIWTNHLSELAEVLQRRLLAAPSPKTHFVISPKLNRDLPRDAAFSVVGETFVGAYTVWNDAAGDDSNFTWLQNTREELHPKALGQYINEVDAFRDPAAPARCFSPASWERLAQVRRAYDPKGAFETWPGARIS